MLSPLPEEISYRLLPMMHSGQSYFSVDKMAEYFEELNEAFGEPERAVSKMMHRPSLGFYLENAIEELQKHKINMDKLPLKKINSRRT